MCLLIGYCVYGPLIVMYQFLTRDIVSSPYYVMHPSLVGVLSAVLLQSVIRIYIMATAVKYQTVPVMDILPPVTKLVVIVTLIAWLFHVILF